MTGRITIVTGTTTGVGKTVATAALAVAAVRRGERVLVVKPLQTGGGDGDSDAREVTRLSGVETVEWIVLDAPLAPDAAARVQGAVLPGVATHAPPLLELAATHDHVIVEGAGGLLVRLDQNGGTLLTLADALRAGGVAPSFVIVTAAGLGTLNHSELTSRAVEAAGHEVAGFVIGSWPQLPGLAEEQNLLDLPHHTGCAILGRIPEGAGSLEAVVFRHAAPGWVSPPATPSP
ncbi:MAG: dethiobiotin synthase [Nocardioides sp.]|uniref:dethiobiotin synthase n=1 Tax=Nocardioides sp. TaxID=35761 RepID=UPI0039E41AF5